MRIKHKIFRIDRSLSGFSDFQISKLEIPAVLQQSHFPSLDGLRAISILMVVLAHIGMSYKTTVDYYPFANAGVQFFFVISGFLITTLLLKEKLKTGNISLRKFYTRRFIRIMPVAFLYLIIVLILNFIFKLNLDLFLVLMSFLFLRNFFVSSSGINHLTTHYWSLSVEEQFYMLFPAILKKKFSFYISLLFTIILFSLFSHPLTLLLDWPFFNSELWKLINKVITQFLGIAIGSLVSILLFSGYIKLKEEQTNRTIKVIILFMIILGFTFLFGTYPNLTIFIESSLFAIILLLSLGQGTDKIFAFLNNKYMKWIGVLSYSLYIWQQPFTLNLTFANSIDFIKNSPYRLQIDIVISMISLIGLFVISWLSYNFYEKRFLKLKDKFK